MNMEWDDSEGDVPTDAYPLEEESVMPIVSLPVYIGALVAVFLVALLTTRGIRLAVYKKKLREAEE